MPTAIIHHCCRRLANWLYSGCLIAVLCAVVVTTQSNAADAASNIDLREAEELLLAVAINGHTFADIAFVLRGTDRRLLVRNEDLLRWRLRAPASGAVSLDGTWFYFLDTLPGLSYRVDESTQTLAIDAPAQLFAPTRLAGSASVLKTPTASQPGGFINYDAVVTQRTDGTAANGLLELGGFNAWGVGVSNFLRREERVVRLASTWTHDRPATMSSLRFGDVISSGGNWGRSVRFGGIQWATNFATQPGFTSFPLPAMAGEAILPSTVDLYVNDALRMRREIPAGPFSIEDLPVLSGQGQARLVVTDLLGRQQVITAPYYASPTLLQEGLHAYSYEMGRIRQNFGTASDDYGRAMAAATYRQGVSDRFSAEMRAEVLERQQTLGVGAVVLWPSAGVFSASMALSHSDSQWGDKTLQGTSLSPGGAGALLGIAFQGQSDWLSYGANIQATTPHLTQIGMDPGRPSARHMGQAFFGISSRKLGSLSLSYVHQAPRDAEKVQIVSSNYSTTLGRLGFLSVSVLHALGGEGEPIFALNFTRLIGERTTASVNATKASDRSSALVQMHRSLPAGQGIGYRFAAGLGDLDRRQAAINLQSQVGSYSVEAAQSRGQTSLRASASGGIAFLAGDAFLSRRLSSSFAVVQVPGYADVGIYQDNQPVARTNAKGNALVGRLRPYQANSLRIEATDLPMDAQIESLGLQAVPYFRSGVLLSFPIQRSRGAVFTILLDDGQPLPAGAIGKIAGSDMEFPVGLRGEIYVTGLNATNRISVSWREQRCEFPLAFPESKDPLPDLGTYTCSAVKP